MKSIVLCGGGTAGHVMPNIALIPKLKKHFNQIHYIGSNGIEKEILKNYPEVKFHQISSVKFVRGFSLKNLAIPFKLIKCISQCKTLLKTIAPDVIFSKGGYVSVPVTMASKSLKIVTIAHESDLSLGLANKLILKTCTKMCCSFKETLKSLNKKGVYTMSPIRDSLFLGNKEVAKQICKFNNNLNNVLIMGGSLGAKAINQVVVNALPSLTKQYNIIHIVGKGNKTNVTSKNYYQLEFAENIQDYLALADFVISRAGSNAINEFLVLNKPMLLIPLPKGNSRGDQVENANNFSKKGFALVLEQEYLNEQSLLKKLKELKIKKNIILKAQAPYKFNNGSNNIVNVILSSLKN